MQNNSENVVTKNITPVMTEGDGTGLPDGAAAKLRELLSTSAKVIKRFRAPKEKCMSSWNMLFEGDQNEEDVVKWGKMTYLRLVTT